MSLCDTCARPGACCFGFELNGGSWGKGMTSLELLTALATVVLDRDNGATAEVGQIGVPFLPFYRKPDGKWRLWCSNLTREGRCGDYENRPGLCKEFAPASDALCIYWKPLAEKCDGCTPYRDRPPIEEKRQEECLTPV